MTTSYSEAVDNIFHVHEQAKNWTTGAINIPVATSLDNDHPQIINLSETIDQGKNVPKPSKRSDDNCYWLPQSLSENHDKFRKEKIHPIFAQACFWAGFVVHGEYETRHKCIQFECMMSKYHDEEKKKKYAANRPRKVKNPEIPPEPRDSRREGQRGL